MALHELPTYEGNSGEPRQKVRLGGMALRNGLLVHGPGHWAVAVRARDGSIKVDSGPKPRFRGPLADLPGVRLPFEDGRMLAAMIGSSIVSAGVRRGGRTPGREGVLAVLGIVPAAL